jgi:DOPA 4,5-dioxygenase
MSFKKYHFHIYFEKDQLSLAKDVVDKLSDTKHLEIGQIRTEPIGPHPVGSCQITVLKEHFLEIVEWFLVHRGDLSVFIHALSGNNILDHTNYVMWIGKPYKINTEFFS